MRGCSVEGSSQVTAELSRASSSAGECGVKDQVSRAQHACLGHKTILWIAALGAEEISDLVDH